MPLHMPNASVVSHIPMAHGESSSVLSSGGVTSGSLVSGLAKDPAEDAANILIRLGFGLLVLVLPVMAVFSRWVIFVLVPVGTIMLVLAAFISGRRDQPFARIFTRMGEWGGITALLWILWVMLSLAWTPQPVVAFEKAFRIIAITALGVAGVFALPQRMRITNLNLVVVGVGVGVILLVIAEIFFALSSRTSPSSVTLSRAGGLLMLMIWTACAWLHLRGRSRALRILVLVATVAVAFSWAGESAGSPGGFWRAILPLAMGALVLGVTLRTPLPMGHRIGGALGALVVLAPVLALLVAWLCARFGFSEAAARYQEVWMLFAGNPVAAFTGRGLGAITLARELRLVSADMPYSLLIEGWYELGLVGALWIAGVIYCLARHIQGMGAVRAPYGLAMLAAAVTYGLVSPGSAQPWWGNALVVSAIAFAALTRELEGAHRPRAPLGGAQDPRPAS